MDKQQANDLAEAIRQDAPWTTVEVKEKQLAYSCHLYGSSSEIDVKSFEQWIQFVESGELSLSTNSNVKPILPGWATPDGVEKGPTF